jgi:hypothetical protein
MQLSVAPPIAVAAMGGYNMEANHTTNAMPASPIAAVRLSMIPYARFHVVRFRDNGECVPQARFNNEEDAESYYDCACAASPQGYFDILTDKKLRETV